MLILINKVLVRIKMLILSNEIDSSISNNSKNKRNNSTSNSQTPTEYVQELSETEAMDVIDPDL